MNAIVEKTRNVLSTLSDIHPAISVSGLTEESVKIQAMKRDLADVLLEIGKDNVVVLTQVASSLHADFVSQAVALESALFESKPQEMDDLQIHNLILTAQLLVKKADIYLGRKEWERQLNGERNGN